MKSIKNYFESIQNINENDALDLCKSKSGIYRVKREGVNFFFYFNPSNKKQLYLFFQVEEEVIVTLLFIDGAGQIFVMEHSYVLKIQCIRHSKFKDMGIFTEVRPDPF